MADEKILTVPLSKMAAELSEKHEMSKKLAGELLADFVDLLVKHLKKGNKVRVTGLGIFQVGKVSGPGQQLVTDQDQGFEAASHCQS
jgi:DNA-binding protein HU-beta